MPELLLTDIHESGAGQFHLKCDADQALRDSYRVPGQFLELQVGEARAYYALASRPGSEKIELLVKNSKEPAESLCRLSPGARIASSVAHGIGFPAVSGDPPPLHLFAMGSGLAPLRALIQAHLAGQWPAASVTLWVGAFDRAYLPFAVEFEDWHRRGVRVVVCLDRAGPDSNGNVIEVLGRERLDLSRARGYWVGSEEFGKAVRSVVGELGMPGDQLMTNI